MDLPDVGEHFAAQLSLARTCAGHDAVARADDDHAQAAEHARNVRLGRVDTQAGLRDALEATDHGHLADVLELHADHRMDAILYLVVALDEALVPEDLRDCPLALRGRDEDLRVSRAAAIADARKHVGDWIGNVHLTTSSTWSRRGARPAVRARGSRCGTGRSGACSHAGGRTRSSGCTPARSDAARASALR